MVDYRTLNQSVNQILDRLKCSFRAEDMASRLTAGEMQMLAIAIEKTGDGEITREAIKDNLKDAAYDGMAGRLTFDENGGGVRQFLLLGVEGGKYVIEEDYGFE